jgi:Peroxisome biogenesis factor 1, N-terminal
VSLNHYNFVEINTTVAFLMRPKQHSYVVRRVPQSTTHCQFPLSFHSCVAGIIELPRSLLPSNIAGSSVPAFVSVQAFPRIEYGTRVDVEPLTTEDWELLEIHSEAMEHGELLNQVSVVYPDQVLRFRVGSNGDQVNIVVKGVQTASSALSESSIWPSIPSHKTSDEITTTTCCVLLVQDTEVVVAPKPRPSKRVSSWTPSLRLLPSDADWGETLDIFKRISALDGEELSVEPCSVLVNADNWQYDNEWSRVKPEKTKNLERLVRVYTSPAVPLGCAGTLCCLASSLEITSCPTLISMTKS